MNKTIPPIIIVIIMLAFFVLLFNVLSIMMKSPNFSEVIMTAPLEMDGDNIFDEVSRYSMFRFTGISIEEMQSLNGVCQDNELIFLAIYDDNIFACLAYPSGEITFRYDPLPN